MSPEVRRRRLARIAVRALLALVLLAVLATAGVFAAVGRGGPPQTEARLGADPRLEEPDTFPIPKVEAPDVVGWPAGVTPTAPEGFTVTRFAGGLDHPRWLYLLPGGDVLVAESATSPKPAESIVMSVLSWLRRNDGATRERSANRITLLRDTDGDGVADFRGTFLDHLNQPFGMALLRAAPPYAVEPDAPPGTEAMFYVANTDGVWRLPYRLGDTRITAPGEKILDLPAGGYNNHWTRNLFAAADGSKLYVTVGSGSNAGEHGLEAERGRAAVLQVDPGGGGARVYASGIRNPNGLGLEPATGTLWAVVNERDVLGDDVSPDYLTRVRDGDFYGWPWSYWGHHVDDRVTPARPDLVARASRPDYSLGAHTAPWGSHSPRGPRFPRPTGAALSSVSTGPGTAATPSDTRSSTCRSPMACPAAGRGTSSPASSPTPATARPMDAPSESPSTRREASWSPTTRATPSGASPRAGDTVWRVAPRR
ncbi:PQQ-dependent sugar dehydrogenase [Microbispora triticiradicis]|uniref:PQQ-dependent sugar dehydrogenase n=1 Tax=Microbispora triticiradicis TaxID=2200763 RepID=UPI001AD817E8|nr:PQQ-dependent sugar dehydrogenase [Microbispora triticiradicis]